MMLTERDRRRNKSSVVGQYPDRMVGSDVTKADKIAVVIPPTADQNETTPGAT